MGRRAEVTAGKTKPWLSGILSSASQVRTTQKHADKAHLDGETKEGWGTGVTSGVAVGDSLLMEKRPCRDVEGVPGRGKRKGIGWASVRQGSGKHLPGQVEPADRGEDSERHPMCGETRQEG